MKQAKQGFLYGTFILGIGTVIVKLIGALFKIPLTNLLGGVGMSYFNVAYDLYYPLYALFISGVPIAVSKLVSENIAQGRVRDARKLLRVALFAFVSIGAVGSLFMFLGAGWFTGIIKNPDARFAVRMLSPAIFFGCITAAFRGYWQGLQDMCPTAVSQIIEALVKLILGLALAYMVIYAGMSEFERLGSIFGMRCATKEQASLAMLPYAAAGAVLGVTAGNLLGAAYLLCRHKLGHNPIGREIWRRSPKPAPAKQLLKQLLGIAVPVCIASMITNFTSFIDLISVMNRLTSAIARDGGRIAAIYHGAIPEGLAPAQVASYLYGCYSGLAVPLYNLVPSLTAVIGVSLLPTISAAWAIRDRIRLVRNLESSVRISSLLAFPAGFGICAMAEPIMHLLYFSKPMEVTVIAPALRLMGISAIFVALTLPVHAVLQAVGRADLPVRLLLIGGLLKLASNYILVGIPAFNIQAAPVGTLICYFFVLSVSLYMLLDATGVEFSFSDTLGKPFLAGGGCALAAKASYPIFLQFFPEAFATCFGIGIGIIVYLILVFSLKIIKEDDIFMFSAGEKFAKLLEKHHLLG